MKMILVDCNYVEHEFAASYLIVRDGPQGKRGFFVECNTNYAIPFLKKAALAEGLSPDQIDGLIVTHIHLDHAGGAGLFLREFPQAKLYAHPRAARHAIDPSKLVASATQVYGEAFMQKMYGTILPCPAERVVALEEGEEISWESTGAKFLTKHVRGHANHHIVVIEPESKTLFSGDAFGVSYPVVNQKRGIVALPSTSPTDFDGDAAIETVSGICDLGLNRVALTHYGFLEGDEIQIAAKQLIDQLRFSMELMKRIQRESMDEIRAFEYIHDWTIQYFAQQKITLDPTDLKLLNLDLKINAQGLVFAANR